jgi:uncharacterized membrane protein
LNSNDNSSNFVSKNRIETLVDGIFAIAMTLLVLGLAVPHITAPVTVSAIQGSIYALLPSFYVLVLSFILLAIFWNNHHRIYSQIKAINGTLLWINIIWLLFIVLIPFSTSLSGTYGSFTIVKVIFNINMLGIAALLYLNAYILLHHKDYIHPDGNRNQLISSANSSIFFIIVVLIALAVSFILPSWANMVYFLIIPYEIRDNLMKK